VTIGLRICFPRHASSKSTTSVGDSVLEFQRKVARAGQSPSGGKIIIPHCDSGARSRSYGVSRRNPRPLGFARGRLPRPGSGQALRKPRRTGQPQSWWFSRRQGRASPPMTVASPCTATRNDREFGVLRRRSRENSLRRLWHGLGVQGSFDCAAASLCAKLLLRSG
jgi:hypothetical protein